MITIELELTEQEFSDLEKINIEFFEAGIDLHDALSEVAEQNGFPVGALNSETRSAHGREMNRLVKLMEKVFSKIKFSPTRPNNN